MQFENCGAGFTKNEQTPAVMHSFRPGALVPRRENNELALQNLFSEFNVRFLLAIFIYLFFAAKSAGAAAPPEARRDRGSEKKSEDFKRYKSLIRGSRRIEISPKKPKEGINSGCVIAYGHFMNPPFNLEQRDNRIFINGVQVQPSLVLQREYSVPRPAEEKKELYRRAHRLAREVERKFNDASFALKAEEQAISDIMAFVRSQSIVEEVKWIGTGMEIRFIGSPVATMVSLKRQSSTTGNVQQRPEEVGESFRKLLKKGLLSGQCFVFGAEGSLSSIDDPRARVNILMRDKTISIEQRVEFLKEIFQDYGLAMDAADNYRQNDWEIRGNR